MAGTLARLTFAPRFCGPPGTVNGGYCAGMVARHSPELLRVRLERPVPLAVPLELEALESGALELRSAGQTLARAWPTQLELEVPRPPEYLEALEASRDYVGFTRHAFPGCFVCGPDRARGDGLRLFAGAIAGRALVAAPWVPDASLGGADERRGDQRKVAAQFMCAALDCPGYFAARSDGVPMLLGELTAQVHRRVHIDEPCTIVGWLIEARGRRRQVGTALFDEDGELCARARAVWIEPRA